MMSKESYPFYVWSGLLTEEHRKNMGSAVWLYLLFVNMTTEEKDGTGFVFGGSAITYEMIQKRLGITRDTYFRWMKILKDEGYINTTHTLHGNSIEVTNSKRRINPTDKRTKNPTDENSSVRETVLSNVGKNKRLKVRKTRRSYIKDDESEEIKHKDKTKRYSNNVGIYIPLSLDFHQKQKEYGLSHTAFKNALTVDSKIVIAGAAELDRIERLDGESNEDIQNVVNFILTDHEFWKGNVTSLSSLRNKGKNDNTKYFNCKNAMKSRGGMQNMHKGRHAIPNEEQQRKQYAQL